MKDEPSLRDRAVFRLALGVKALAHEDYATAMDHFLAVEALLPEVLTEDARRAIAAARRPAS